MKKIVAAVMAAAFVTATGAAIAAEQCTVDAVEGSKVTMTCEKNKLKAEAKVTVQAEKEKAAAEKCTVSAVEGDKVTVTCEKTELKAGDKVKVKAEEGKPVEGC